MTIFMMKRITIITSMKIVCFMALLSVAGCISGPAVQHSKTVNGKVYGVTEGLFNHRWWNYHERGISFADGHFWQESENDLKMALQKRDRDQRRARTYGMHFVDYFPHRELGIVYYETGRYEDAITELQKSLSDEESAKAKYYLNLARKALLSRDQTDSQEPHISQLSWPESQVVNTSQLALQGVVSDDTFVKAISINDKPLFIELSENRILFEHTHTLDPGENTVRISAVDLVGRKSSVERKVVLDVNGPTTTIENILEKSPQSYFISGYVTDAVGLSTIHLGSEKQSVPIGAKEFYFETVISGTHFDISAQDLAGNISSDSIDLNDTNFLAITGWPEKLIRTASLDSQPMPQRYASTNLQKKSGPIFSAKGFSDYQEVFVDKIFIEGRILSSTDIVLIEINGEPLDFKPGKRLYINHLVGLTEGSNIISIVIRDGSGAEYSKEITFDKKTTKPKDIGSRMVIGVMPFTQTSATGDLSEPVFDFFQTKLVEQSRFHLVTRKDLDLILQELKLSASVLVDPANAVRVGKLVAADNIVSGKVYQKDNTIEVTINTIDTETSTIVASLDVYSESTALNELQYLMEGLSLKLENRFPLLDGLIIKINGDKYYIDKGKSSGLRAETKIVSYREIGSILHPITGKNLGVETEELGTLEVINVQEDFSVARPLAGAGNLIKVMDKFITK